MARKATPGGSPAQPNASSMLTSTISPAWRASSHRVEFRFGRETGGPSRASWSVEWVFRRNQLLAPRQVVWLCASLCVLSLGLASVLWLHGATTALPFAWLELALVGVALLIYARHAADSERIALRGDELTVENTSGDRVRRVAFQPSWVRVEPRHGDRSLIDLSGQGRRICVGRFVRPELRVQLADELRWALRRWQQRAGRSALRDEAVIAQPRHAADLALPENAGPRDGPAHPRVS